MDRSLKYVKIWHLSDALAFEVMDTDRQTDRQRDRPRIMLKYDTPSDVLAFKVTSIDRQTDRQTDDHNYNILGPSHQGMRVPVISVLYWSQSASVSTHTGNLETWEGAWGDFCSSLCGVILSAPVASNSSQIPAQPIPTCQVKCFTLLPSRCDRMKKTRHPPYPLFCGMAFFP